jgi:hypothetical protein
MPIIIDQKGTGSLWWRSGTEALSSIRRAIFSGAGGGGGTCHQKNAPSPSLNIAQTISVGQSLSRYRGSLINFRNRSLICKARLRTPKIPEIWVPVVERRASKQAAEKVRVQEGALSLQRRLLQRREWQIKVQANRIAELENMIGLRTSAALMLMNEPFMPNLDSKVS